ncbi:zinc ribbon domain-containing protein [Chloroflexota bacterium]
MPIYEYRCNSCKRRVSVFVRDVSSSFTPSCEKCGSQDLVRIYSSFAVRRSQSDKSVYEDILSDKKLTNGLMKNDPRALAEWTRKMSKAADEDTNPATEEILERMDAGEDASSVVSSYKGEEITG